MKFWFLKKLGITNYPELRDLEVALKKSIKKNEEFKFTIDTILLTEEKWKYLVTKYPILLTNLPNHYEFHPDYLKNKIIFEKYKKQIEENIEFCPNKFEIPILLDFTRHFFPNRTEINLVEPIEIKTQIAGFRFHDYKKKEVKQMLEFDSYQQLDLIHEFDNQFDSYAIKLLWKNYFLGYIPRIYSKQVFEAIENKYIINCWLTKYYNFGNIDDRTQIEITIKPVSIN